MIILCCGKWYTWRAVCERASLTDVVVLKLLDGPSFVTGGRRRTIGVMPDFVKSGSSPSQPQSGSLPGYLIPKPTPEQVSRIARCGRRRSTSPGEVLVEIGDRVVGFFLVLSGEIRTRRTFDDAERLNTSLGAGEFWGESCLLGGFRSIARLRVSKAGEVIELTAERLFTLVQADPEWSEILMRSLFVRRLEVVARHLSDVIAICEGMDGGVTKPGGTEEPLTRILAALRRVENRSATNAPISRGGLVIDRERFRVHRDGETVRLTPKEFDLLTLLAQHPGRVVPRHRILEAIWGSNAIDQPAQLRVLVGSLRKKIERNPASPKYILTEPWVGYRLIDE